MNNELPLSEQTTSRPSSEGERMPDYSGGHCRYPPDSRRMVFAGALIIAGLVFLANTMGYLPQVAGVNQWNWIALGVGVLLLGEWLMRAVSGDASHHSKGNLIMAGILIAIGLSGVIHIHFSWPLILIAIGVASLFGTLSRRI
jgi:hypothetical protein